MPTWVYVIITAAAVITAVSVIWKKFLQPLIHFIGTIEKMVPVLITITEVFKDAPHAFNVLDEIQAQFRTDSGSSLLDIINRLEDAAKAAVREAEILATSVEATRYALAVDRELAIRDREKLRELLLRLDRLTVKVDDNTKKGEETGRTIDKIVESRKGVAEDLAASQKRAEEAISREAGAAADAATIKSENGIK